MSAITLNDASGRRKFLLSLLALVAMSMFGRAVYLQVFNNEFLQKQGNSRYQRVLKVPAYRGMITDRNGHPLAVSSPVDSVWAVPGEVLENDHMIPLLAARLGMGPESLRAKLESRKNKQFVYLKRHLDPSAAQAVMDLRIPGVDRRREYRRFYPEAEVAAQILGSTNIDDQGQEGIELTYNDWLTGTPGSERVLRNGHGRVVEAVERATDPLPGKNLALSIDRRIQYMAYRALKAAMIEHNASAASAVVIDVKTGEILAMANQPGGNPNDRKSLKPEQLRNRAVTDVFEPGSVLKPFTIAAALEAGTFRPGSIVNTSPGQMKVGRNMVRDVRNYGKLDVTHVISKSSNVGTTKIAMSMPKQNLWEMYTKLGFGRSSGINFPGEEAGMLSDHSTWSDFEYATLSFGYGVSTNALQLAQSYAVLASGGVVIPPTLVRRDKKPEQVERLFSERTARQVRGMLEEAVSKKGTGYLSNVAGYRVAGKTGTVKKIINGAYAKKRYYSLFAGMAPASDPRLVMAVVIDDARGKKYYGGLVAAPVFSNVMSDALRILNVAPDAPMDTSMQFALTAGGQM